MHALGGAPKQLQNESLVWMFAVSEEKLANCVRCTILTLRKWLQYSVQVQIQVKPNPHSDSSQHLEIIPPVDKKQRYNDVVSTSTQRYVLAWSENILPMSLASFWRLSRSAAMECDKSFKK